MIWIILQISISIKWMKILIARFLDVFEKTRVHEFVHVVSWNNHISWCCQYLDLMFCQIKIKQILDYSCNTSDAIWRCLSQDCSNRKDVIFRMLCLWSFIIPVGWSLFTQCTARHFTNIVNWAKYQCIKKKCGELIWTWEFWVRIKNVMRFHEFVEL